MTEKPIGMFDSGVGGISVLAEIKKFLPAEDIIYYADSAHCPYGIKPPGEILQRSLRICDWLLGQNAKLLVVACNTASIVGLNALRQRYDIPIVGMEPAVKPAFETTKNGRIGVMATGVTLAGDRFFSLLERFKNETVVYTQPCPGLVELVEQGKAGEPGTRKMLEEYLQPLLDKRVDTIVLGCTHYPFLRDAVRDIAGDGVRILDSGVAVARQAHRVLTERSLGKSGQKSGRENFYTSGNPAQVGRVIGSLMGLPEVCAEYEPLD